MRKHYLFLITLINPWLFKILLEKPHLGLTLILTTFFFYFKLNFRLALLLFFLTLLIQYQTTNISSLTRLTNDQNRLHTLRLNAYYPKFTHLGYYLEIKPEIIAIQRILKNIGDVVDFNLYFFASHPRSRPEISEFEKFPYLLLPFFLIGLITFFQKEKILFILLLCLPISLIALIGNHNYLGPFSLFPFLVISITHGLNSTVRKHKLFLLVFLLTLIQTISYVLY